MDIIRISSIAKKLFSTQQTKDISFRKNALKKLQKELIKREKTL